MITIEEKKDVRLKQNDILTIKHVEGMSEINEIENVKILSKNDNSNFIIDLDTTNFGKYIQGGLISKVKQPIIKNYKSFTETINILFNRKNIEENIVLDENEDFLFLFIYLFSFRKICK